MVYTNPVCTKEMSLVAPLQSLTHLPFLSSFSPLRVSLLHCPSPPLAPSFLLPPFSFPSSTPLLFSPSAPSPCPSHSHVQIKARDQNSERSGYLLVKGKRGWKRKWFVLSNLALYSFAKHEDRAAKESIIVPSHVLVYPFEVGAWVGVGVGVWACGCVCRHVCLLWWRQLRLVVVGKCH